MASIRTTRTASGATAVQVVSYSHRRVRVLKHIGSAHDEGTLNGLIEQAQAWLENCGQTTLFPAVERATENLTLSGTEFLGAWHTLVYEVLDAMATRCGFNALNDRLLLDLAIMRLVEPTSKRRSMMLLDSYFGIGHSRNEFYRRLPGMLRLKPVAERVALDYAKGALRSELSLVLYDVTTLYFETFDADELRVPGFSKDNMHQQPQIVVGLLVTRDGFPLAYEIFPGNTFEGKTMLPILDAFVQLHRVSMPTVVADAAMLSRAMVEQLIERKLFYIVGARLANSPQPVIDAVVSALGGRDGRIVRVPTKHGDMICSFSAKRFKKDKATFDKQVAKATQLVAKGEPGKRAKFVAADGTKGYRLDEALKAKTESLLGIKGYCTNIPRAELSDAGVISRYHDLWNVEKAFRMAKSDLATRPIFHFDARAIRVHLLICFVALALARAIELASEKSLRQVIDALWPITDARLFHPILQRHARIRASITPEAKEILVALGVPY